MQLISTQPLQLPALCCREEFEDWLQLIKSEYAEMPGLQLSKRQAQRLWGLDAERLQALLDTLESSHFLKRNGKDLYLRADIGCC